jgi:hypothetical protein
MSALRTKISELAWVAPGVVCAAVAVFLWGGTDQCDSGGCAVGTAMGVVSLPIVWLVSAILCAKLAAFLAARRRLSLGLFVPLVGATFAFLAAPLVAVAFSQRFLVSEVAVLAGSLFVFGAVVAAAWWGLKHGITLSPQAALPPNTSFERTREG